MSSHVHALNNSSSHQKYAFPKGKRFTYQQPKTDVYYLPKIDKDKRSALIGYGKKSLGIVNQKAYQNTPHAYSIPSSISGKKGVSFSSGRHLIGSPFQNIKYVKEYPSPLNYKVSSQLDKKGGKFGSKLKDYSLKYFQSLPGPGSYSLPSTIDGTDGNNKRIYESRFSSGGSYVIGKINSSQSYHEDRKDKFQVPGPGQYNLQKYGLSNPQNPLEKHSSVVFPKQHRSSLGARDADKIPGPGQYKLYSPFDS